jgi:hypothetical protein
LAAQARATTRFETAPGKQLQIDFGERLVEIAGPKVKVFLFVGTLGYSRRLHVRAFRNERQESWFAGLESAFAMFGGITDEVLFDNARALVVDHDAVTRSVVFNDKLLAFAKHWGFRPRACAPYPAPLRARQHLSSAHRTVSCTGANHSACTGADRRPISLTRARRPLTEDYHTPRFLPEALFHDSAVTK